MLQKGMHRLPPAAGWRSCTPGNVQPDAASWLPLLASLSLIPVCLRTCAQRFIDTADELGFVIWLNSALTAVLKKSGDLPFDAIVQCSGHRRQKLPVEPDLPGILKTRGALADFAGVNVLATAPHKHLSCRCV
jgi:hypothetical protein